MMEFGDIVVVSIQYRLGALGFLSTMDAVAPGNYAMHDQVDIFIIPYLFHGLLSLTEQWIFFRFLSGKKISSMHL